MAPPSKPPRAVGFADAIFLGRCPRCKVRRRVHAPILEVRVRQRGYGMTERVHVRSVHGSRVEGYDRIFVSCGCGAATDLRLLRGVVAPRVQCNAACMNAHGPACECSCGGANHGRSFA